MADSPDQGTLLVTTTDVLLAVSEALDDDPGIPSQIRIMRQDDYTYVVRVYNREGDDFEGLVVSLPR